MPIYKSHSVLEIARNLRAFLNLEAGLTRGEAPDTEQQIKVQAQNRIERQSRELERLRGSPSKRDPTTTFSQPGLDTASARENLAKGPFGSLAADRTSKPLRIVQVALDDVAGGGARAAYGLNAALRRLGHDSSMFVANRHSEDPTVQAFEPPADPQSRSMRRSRKERIKRDFDRYEASRPTDLIGYGFTGDRSMHGAEPLEQLPPCDIVNLHWFGDFLDYRAFFPTVPQHTPVVWTLHDMNGFTGGCHWDAGCGKFIDSCGACPQLGSTDEEDLSRDVWRRKHDAFTRVESEQLHLVSPSRWLADEIRRSSLLGKFPATVIRNGADSQTFAPRDRALSRSALGIPSDAAVLLFVADSLITVRKGFALLAEALEGMADVPNFFLLSLGNFNPSILKTVPRVHLDYIVNDDLLLSHVYSAADVLVVPSLQDNLPFTALEAMSCGTPVVAFDTGGMPDIVLPGITGELAPLKDVDALRRAMSDLLRDPEKRAELSANCRRMLVEEFAYDVQAGRYVELYRSLLKAHAK